MTFKRVCTHSTATRILKSSNSEDLLMTCATSTYLIVLMLAEIGYKNLIYSRKKV